jgi:hypothetical protein
LHNHALLSIECDNRELMITFTVRHFKQFEVFSVYTDVKAKKNYTVCSLDFSQLDKGFVESL